MFVQKALGVARRPWGVGVEVGFVALVLVLWQLARIPLEGGRRISVDHAGSWLAVEKAIRFDFEDDLVDLVDRLSLFGPLDWIYGNVHVPVLFGFMAAARLLAPQRYPLVRTTYVLSFLPALLVIGLYPLAPPRWLPEFGGSIPTDDQLTGSFQVLIENSTAAAASQHFGFALMVAAASLWLWPRSAIGIVALAYPALVFLVIVGTAEHYVLDCVIGTFTFVTAVLLARRVHGTSRESAPDLPQWSLLLAAAGYALCAWSVEALHDDPKLMTVALTALVGALAVVLGPRIGQAVATAREEGWHGLSASQEEVGVPESAN
jgi:PAP2 superfamily protein